MNKIIPWVVTGVAVVAIVVCLGVYFVIKTSHAGIETPAVSVDVTSEENVFGGMGKSPTSILNSTATPLLSSRTSGVSTSTISPTISIISPAQGAVLKEGVVTGIQWNMSNLPHNTSHWSILGSLRCDPSMCGRTGLNIFSYPLSGNPGSITWKTSPPIEIDRFRGKNKSNYDSYGLNPTGIASSLIVCLVEDGADEVYSMGRMQAEGLYCSNVQPITILFNPPLSY